MPIGFLIPEFPGQTHSFFWREMLHVKSLGLEPRVVSTRLPAQPVSHDWVTQAQVDYLFPLKISDAVPLITGLLLIRRLLKDPAVRPILRTPRNWAWVLMAIKLAALCKRMQIDHLHVHSCANAALIAAFCHALFGQPYSLVLHGPVEDYGPYQHYKWAGAKFVFIITEKLAAQMKAQMPQHVGKIHVMPMGVDTDVFAPPNTSTQNEVFQWFSCARLNKVKGFETLIAAVAQIKKTNPELTLHVSIAGEDEQGGSGYRATLEKMIASHELGETITLLGAVTQGTILDHLQRSDAFVLASRHEPLGVAYMEAMACGLATIGTDAGGVKELINDQENGLLVPPDTPADLAAAMIAIMTQSGLRQKLQVGGRARIVESFGAHRSAVALKHSLNLK